MEINGEAFYYYILIKLQAEKESLLPFRLLEYMVAFWNDYLECSSRGKQAQKSLPVLVPVVIYGGRRAWSACRSFHELAPLAGKFMEELLDFPRQLIDFTYQLIDVKHFPAECLEWQFGLFSNLVRLEQCKDPEDYHRGLLEVGSLLDDYDQSVRDLFLEWFVITAYPHLSESAESEMLLRIKQSEPQQAQQLARKLAIDWRLGHDAVWRADFEKGKREVAIKVAKNMIADNMDEELIVEVCCLAPEEVRQYFLEYEQERD
jgi:hypothetical protein